MELADALGDAIFVPGPVDEWGGLFKQERIG